MGFLLVCFVATLKSPPPIHVGSALTATQTTSNHDSQRTSEFALLLERVQSFLILTKSKKNQILIRCWELFRTY